MFKTHLLSASSHSRTISHSPSSLRTPNPFFNVQIQQGTPCNYVRKSFVEHLFSNTIAHLLIEHSKTSSLQNMVFQH
ncbi:hypothetical protein SLEP1_g50601 [Rubroshorea leprosula]|uniref:Uncharacterized protein n=1 Tax=Rubroshorea leprosula TaxID=152421 RepID=A0AAV5M1B9_9ROSI|nr:hypothetical protein SLEP1_g50601 [Rubroshorea leprosula]